MFSFFGFAAAASAALPHLISPVSTPTVPGYFFQRGGHYANYLSLVISPDGQVVDCKESNTKGNLIKFDNVCPAVRGAQFSPARLDDGRATYSTIDQLFMWPDDHTFNVVDSDINLTVEKLPKGFPLHPRVEVALHVDAAGQVVSCRAYDAQSTRALDKIACEKASSAGLVRAVKDAKGNPVESQQILTVGFGAYTDLVVKKDYAYAALGEAGHYFPERAIRLNVEGYAIIECAADSAGQLSDCTLDEETPLGFNFGKTALQMAKDKWMRVKPAEAGPVLLRVDFPRSGNFQ